MKRRQFLKNSAVSAMGYAGLSAVPAMLSQEALAVANGKTVIKIFLRGGMDGLSLLVPKSNAQYNIYASARKDLKIGKGQLLGLKGTGEFGLHPEAKRIRGLFNNAQAVFAHGAGSLNNTRSHFTQMDIIEGGKKESIASTGYFYRAFTGSEQNLDMVSVGASVAKSMRGVGSKAIAMGSPESFSRMLGAQGQVATQISKADRIEGMSVDRDGNCSYKGKIRAEVCKNAQRTAASVDKVGKSVRSIPSLNAEKYGSSSTASQLRQAVRLVCSNLGPKVINVNMGGWDTHFGQGVLNGKFRDQIIKLDKMIGAARDDLKAQGKWNNTVILVMSEFGRTLAQNGTGGTDHGRGGVMMVFGGNLRNPGRVIAPSFDLKELDIRDVRVSVDYRKIAAELLLDHMKFSENQVQNAFPGLALRKDFYNIF
ncbi:MAG: DUF1501 domain-containing protein [Pseudomonadota bacterium]